MLTAIIFAVNKGFTRIVVHGIDFGGGYFFDSDPIFRAEGLVPPPVPEVYDSEWRKQGAAHPTGQCLRLFLAELKSRLLDRDVELIAGCAESPASELLGT